MEGGPIVVNLEGDEEVQLDLPPGFRFHPTDEEIITHYLTHKLLNPNFTATAIGEVDLNKCEPWDLPKKAKMGEKEWYFFCQRDRKYPTGMRTNRATETGYWKATGKDKEIYGKAKSHSSGGQLLVGMKKTLVFYKGRAPKGEKTNWVMHEFRVDGQLCYHNFPNRSVAKDEWVVCKVFHKNATMINKKDSVADLTRMNSFAEGIFDSPSLPTLMDSPYNPNANNNGTNTFAPSFSIASDGKFTTQMQQHSYMTSNPSTIHQSTQTTYNYQNYNQTAPNNSMLFYTQNANVPYQASSSLGNYLHQERLKSVVGNRQCKVEQYSSNLSRSQDTGLSTDLTAEISSRQEVERSKPTYNNNADHVEGASAGHLEDYDSFWNFQV